jgi:hypothetical protein
MGMERLAARRMPQRNARESQRRGIGEDGKT